MQVLQQAGCLQELDPNPTSRTSHCYQKHYWRHWVHCLWLCLMKAEMMQKEGRWADLTLLIVLSSADGCELADAVALVLLTV